MLCVCHNHLSPLYTMYLRFMSSEVMFALHFSAADCDEVTLGLCQSHAPYTSHPNIPLGKSLYTAGLGRVER